MTRVLSLVLVIASCGRSTTPPVAPRPRAADPVRVAVPEPAPLDRDLPRLAARATRMYQEIVETFTLAGDNCAIATTRLGALRQTYADVVAANGKVLRDGRANELRAALEPHRDALDAAAKAVVGSTIMAACAHEAAFTDAFDDLVGAPP